jgi:hypothetical protein
MSMKGLLFTMLFVTMLPFGGDLFTDGVRAYLDGRFEEALAAFDEAEEEAGFDASAELLHNKAMAALGSGELLVAEYSAEKAAVRGGPAFTALRDFLLGSTAFARCEKAETETEKPDAKPSAFDPAIAHAGTALKWWQRAAAGRSDWPEARRNVERALRKLDSLKKKKEGLELRIKNMPEKKKIEVQTDPLLQTDPDGRQLDSKVKPQLDEMTSDLVKRLLEKLEAKEKEKQKLRRARQRLQRGEVEKDW